MVHPTKPLNSHIEIHFLLNLLGCRPPIQGIPLQTRCPICRDGMLTIYRDLVMGGGWHHCSQCKSQGDLISLAAATLKVSRSEAIAHLAVNGAKVPTDPESVGRDTEHHTAYARRLTDFWDLARRSHRSRPDFAKLAQKLGLNPNSWNSHWQQSIGQIVGVSNKTIVETCFAPESMAARKAKGWTGSQSSHRVFVGSDWDSVLVLPFFDLPGRISSFVFIGRDANPERDFVVKRANRGLFGRSTAKSEGEGGLLFHPEVFDSAAALNGTIIAVADPLLLLRLHVRDSRDHFRPLSMVAWLDTAHWPPRSVLPPRAKTHSAWQMFYRHRIVFWAPDGLNINVLRQAIAADGLISTAGPTVKIPEELQKYLSRERASHLVEHASETARPWQDVLSQYLENSRPPAIHRWVADLEHERDPVEPILDRCSQRAREHARAVMNANRSPRTIALNGRIIRETSTCWELERRSRASELILNAVIRIDRILVDRDRNIEYARGRVLFGDDIIEFCEPLARLDRDMFSLLRRRMLDAQLGILHATKRFRKDLLQIAISFQEPLRVDAVTHVGWRRDDYRIVFPHFQINADGSISQGSDNLIPDHAPGRCLKPLIQNCGIDPFMLELSQLHPELAKLFWATMAYVVANLVTPAFANRTTGLCLVGRGAQSVCGAIAEAMGCLKFTVRLKTDLKQAMIAEHLHGMPLILELSSKLRGRQKTSA